MNTKIAVKAFIDYERYQGLGINIANVYLHLQNRYLDDSFDILTI